MCRIVQIFKKVMALDSSQNFVSAQYHIYMKTEVFTIYFGI